MHCQRDAARGEATGRSGPVDLATHLHGGDGTVSATALSEYVAALIALLLIIMRALYM